MPLAEGRLERLQILKLLQCVRNEDVEQIEKLITNGVPHLVNYSEPESGETALHLAASQNNEKIISLLLDLGASPNMVDLKGRSPAMRAVELGHVQALILLTEAGTDMTIRDIENKGILFYCLQPTRRHLDCLRLSIDHGASVNNVSKDGQPLIVVAAEAGLEEMTKVLLESGSNPNSKHEKTGFTALQAAAMSGSLECARAILEAGADYDVIDNENVHAAHKAASKGYLDIIRLLAAYGADLGKVSLDGNTPMHLAAAKGFGAVCKFLGQRGCSSTFKNKEGKTPKMLAKDNEHKEALKECKKAEKVAARLAKGTGKGPGAPYAVRLYDWLQEHEKRVLNMFHQFDQEDKEGKFKGKVTQENFVVCLQTLNVPVEAEDLQKLALVHDPNKEDNVDYNLFLTGKKFINKQYMVSQGKKKKKKGGKKGRRKKGKTKVPLPICTAPDGPRTKNGGPPPNYVERYVSFTDYTRFNRDHPPTHPIQDDSAWYLNSPETTYISINDAAKMGDLESIKVAIYRGMSVDQRDKFFKTPLMTSCAHGNIEMARALLDFGLIKLATVVGTSRGWLMAPVHFQQSRKGLLASPQSKIILPNTT